MTLRRKVTVVLALSALIPSMGVAQTVVHPTGQFPTDVNNVQAALDGGGTVLLKATNASGTPTAFQFGPPLTGRGLSFNTDAVLLGETAGGHHTTIRGGRSVIRVIGPPVAVRVEGIHFDGPGNQAMIIVSATKAEIIGNRIENVVGIPIDANTTRAIGINEGLTPDLVIENNVIARIDADFGLGIVQCCTAGSARIAHNIVTGVNTFGIESAINDGTVEIQHNTVIPDAVEDPGGFDQGTGISLLGGSLYTVSHNTVVTGRPGARGIQGLDFNLFEPNPLIAPLIMHNDIVTTDADAAILLGGEVSDARVRDNRIAGSGIVAMAALDSSGQGAELLLGNAFEDNDIAGYESDEADVFLDATTRDALLSGSGGTVIDLGINNTIEGFTTIRDRHVGDKLRK